MTIIILLSKCIGELVFKRLCGTLNGHPLGKFLSQITAGSEALPDLYNKYLEDFLCTRALGSADVNLVIHVYIIMFCFTTSYLLRLWVTVRPRTGIPHSQ